MDKQVKNIELLEDGSVRFKTGRVEVPKNEVIKIKDGAVYFLMNDDQLVGQVDVADYFRLSLWAHRLTFDHADLSSGVVAYDNGYEHKSLAAAIMQTQRGQKVTYVNKNNRCNCRRDNLVVKGEDYYAAV